MGLKKEFKRHIRNLMKDIESEILRKWKIDYKGHTIEIKNELYKETLYINGKIADQNKRKSVLSQITPYSKLSGAITLEDGTTQKVSVKIGGYFKLNCIVKVGNEIVFKESEKMEFLPWENKERIVPYILGQIEVHNKIVDDSLPDDRYYYDDDEPRPSPGFADLSNNDIPTPFFAKKLIKLFSKQLKEPNDQTRKATYEHIIFDQMISNVTEFLNLIRKTELDKARIQEEALWFLENACHREVVKFAIILLGLTGCDDYKELLLKIGMHEEFTTFTIFAFKSGTTNPNESIFQLAQSVHGWGKIEAVNHLEATTPEIKQWILTKGCINNIRNSYLAYECAMKGKLDIELYEDDISREIYEGAGIIIEALLDRVAAYAIEEYPYAGAVLSRFVHHSQKHCSTIEDFVVLLKINKFVNEDEQIWELRYENNWKPHERNSIKEMLAPFLNETKWGTAAYEKLKDEFSMKAFIIADFFNIDVTAKLFTHLEKEPTNSKIYFGILKSNNQEHIKKLCDFAEKHLSLLKGQREGEYCIQLLLQSISDFEGIGLPIVKEALNLKYVGPFYALAVLNKWSKTIWMQQDVKEALKKVAATAKDDNARKLAKQLLAR